MAPPTARPPEQIIALYERLAAVLATSAELADQHILQAERANRAPPEQAATRRGELAAERARRAARRLRVREEARRLFSHPPRWCLVFAGSDTPGARRLHELEAA